MLGKNGWATEFHGFTKGSTRIKHWGNYPCRAQCCSPLKKMRVDPFCYPRKSVAQQFFRSPTDTSRNRVPLLASFCGRVKRLGHGFSRIYQGINSDQELGNCPCRANCCSRRKIRDHPLTRSEGSPARDPRARLCACEKTAISMRGSPLAALRLLAPFGETLGHGLRLGRAHLATGGPSRGAACAKSLLGRGDESGRGIWRFLG